jgi:radical SAM-linked protein
MLAVRFRIGGLLRFLSHAETLRVFQRACTRAGVPVQYTAGFNPHPRLSLPLPRTVGMASDDEMLVVRLSGEPADGGEFPGRTYEDRMQRALQATLPTGIEIVGVESIEAAASPHARLVDTVFVLRSDRAAEFMNRLDQRIRAVLASEPLVVERRLPPDRKARRIDVRPFLESIQRGGQRITVRCRVTAVGAVRMEEIMRLLELDREDLAAPVRRAAVEWISA